MSCDVQVNDPARTHFHDHQDVQHSKTRCHDGEEIAGQVQRQLFAQEKVLSGESSIGLQAEPDEPQDVQQQIERGPQQVGQGIEFRHQGQNRTPESP